MSGKYDLDVPKYNGVDQVVELAGRGHERTAEEVVKLAERQDL